MVWQHLGQHRRAMSGVPEITLSSDEGHGSSWCNAHSHSVIVIRWQAIPFLPVHFLLAICIYLKTESEWSNIAIKLSEIRNFTQNWFTCLKSFSRAFSSAITVLISGRWVHSTLPPCCSSSLRNRGFFWGNINSTFSCFSSCFRGNLEYWNTLQLISRKHGHRGFIILTNYLLDRSPFQTIE